MNTSTLVIGAAHCQYRINEQFSWVQAAQESFAEYKDETSSSRLSESLSSLTPQAIVDDQPIRFQRLLCRLAALDPCFPQEGLIDRFSECTCAEFSEETAMNACSSFRISVRAAGRDLISMFLTDEKGYCQFLQNPMAFDLIVGLLSERLFYLEKCSAEITKCKELSETFNVKMLVCLRKILTCPLYKALCCNESHPFVHLVHKLVLDLYSNTQVNSVLQALGSDLCQLVGNKGTLSDRIAGVWQCVSNFIPQSTESTWGDSWYRFKKSMATSIHSCVGSKSIPFFLSDIFDERFVVADVPGCILSENGNTRLRQTISLRTPVMSGKHTPEFRAALQAMENTLFSSDQSFAKNASSWVCTHFLDDDWDDTCDLIKLTEEYPLSFHLMVLNKNAREREILFPKGLNEFENSSSSSLEFAAKHATTFLSPMLREEHWGRLFTYVEGKACSVVNEQLKNREFELQSIIFRELFFLGCIECHENVAFSLQTLRKSQSGAAMFRSVMDSQFSDFSTRMATTYLWAMKNQSPQNSDLVVGTFFGRSFLDKKKLVEKKEAALFSLFIATIDPLHVNKFFHSIQKHVSNTRIREKATPSSIFTPASIEAFIFEKED